ncbi:MAG: hypothetical protein E5W81_14510 [Mesorhizobium sp.]|uniref:transposase n=1 Tax=Mesorhizobium sp. TaxID=1871066 RepID=UPI0012182DD3|nr:transposase [Mesorhizobium sp.]TIT17868.1 MAG: hypothetical protein E5W70_31070 [Mesorhizobium sp.]TIX46092.1 MAG: hypothetical protein E5V36_02965 [Mesorhizobium sp.]TKB31794.1 MAG: hypothetical protein E5W69_01140 [Mesorhizobium sp.]TKB78000.1 MAG: hypothetical protein E5W81_14510 [Mesorhizobium sp.]
MLSARRTEEEKDSGRRFSCELKLAAVRRETMRANVSKPSRELGVWRKGLYQWQKQCRVGGLQRPPTGRHQFRVADITYVHVAEEFA